MDGDVNKNCQKKQTDAERLNSVKDDDVNGYVMETWGASQKNSDLLLKGQGQRPCKRRLSTPCRRSQGFQSGPVPGTFTRLRSCIVPAEITEPPKISGGQNQKYDGR